MTTEHPDAKLLDYVGGHLDEEDRRTVEAHLSSCRDCAETVNVVRHLRESKPHASTSHPDISQLAEFFYNPAPRPSAIAAHVALCQSCADAISEYARAECAAGEYYPSSWPKGAVPDAAWQTIREWEESVYASPRMENRESEKMLVKLAEMLSRSKEEIDQLSSQQSGEDLVSVIIVDKLARLRGVALFEKTTTSEGESLLRPVEESGRFDNKPFHVLLDFGEDQIVMVSDIVRHDTIRLQRITRANTSLKRVDFFIVEE
ncbi:MAG: zf-HC2 domain-containing protein [Acidobacteriota bacterium]